MYNNNKIASLIYTIYLYFVDKIIFQNKQQ